MRIRALVLAFAFFVVPVAAVFAATSRGCQGPTSFEAPAPTLYDRVVFIGASASSGYKLGAGVNLASVFEDRLAVPHYNVSNLADGTFYVMSTAERNGIVEKALTRQPTLVVALDFLFWFAHGVPPDDASRRAAMDEGLRLLEHFTCPVIVGDIPDVTAATVQVPMLKYVLPKPATRAWANERIRQWVSERNRTSPTLLVPLAEAVAVQMAGGRLSIGGNEYGTDGLLQADRLHPTLAGEIMLCRLIEQTLVDGRLSRPTDFK